VTEQEFLKLTKSPKREKKETTNWNEILKASRGLGKLLWGEYFMTVAGLVKESERGKLKQWVEKQGEKGELEVTYEGRIGMDYTDRKRFTIHSVTG